MDMLRTEVGKSPSSTPGGGGREGGGRGRAPYSCLLILSKCEKPYFKAFLFFPQYLMTFFEKCTVIILVHN